MFRPSPSASRAVFRALNNAIPPSSSLSYSAFRPIGRAQLCTRARRPQLGWTGAQLSSSIVRARFADHRGPMDTIDRKREEAIQQQKMQPDPDGVTSTSSVHPILSEVHQHETVERDTDMLAGAKADLKTIRDTFRLDDVPRQAYYIGLAGVLPYVATSASTIYCAWEINHAATTGLGYLLTEKTAEIYLHILEPLQVGYGATIISFLGAIHWGLEFAKFGGEQGYPRYAIGVFATALAWPTLLLPVEAALISQFVIFNFLYYADSRASKLGWAPAWYGVYRFVLTFIVGASIVSTLIWRGHVSDRVSRPAGVADKVRLLQEQQAEEEIEEEEARRKYLSSGKAGEDEEEEEEGEEEEEKEEEE